MKCFLSYICIVIFDLGDVWQMKEGTLLTYELILQYLIKNHCICIFGCTSSSLQHQGLQQLEDQQPATPAPKPELYNRSRFKRLLSMILFTPKYWQNKSMISPTLIVVFLFGGLFTGQLTFIHIYMHQNLLLCTCLHNCVTMGIHA